MGVKSPATLRQEALQYEMKEEVHLQVLRDVFAAMKVSFQKFKPVPKEVKEATEKAEDALKKPRDAVGTGKA